MTTDDYRLRSEIMMAYLQHHPTANDSDVLASFILTSRGLIQAFDAYLACSTFQIEKLDDKTIKIKRVGEG